MPKSQSDLLSEISGTVQRVEARQEIHAESFTKRLDRIDRSLDGNGQPGLKTRLDRVEQHEKGRARLLWLTLTTAIAGLGSWILSHWK